MTADARAAVAAAQAAGAGPAAAAVLLGSGFDAVARSWPVLWRLPYREIPGMPTCQVRGHRGELLGVELGDAQAWVFSGRLHAYEGRSLEEVVFPVDVAAAAGARHLLLTCAAGGIAEGMRPGDMVLVEDHINLSGLLPPLGRDGFLDLSAVYHPGGGEAMAESAAGAGAQLARGVLAMVRGPAYETPAEVRMLARLGADLVSMSTVPEAIRAHALGLQVVALACIANLAAGRVSEPVYHGDVLQRVAQRVAGDDCWLLQGLRSWARDPSD